MKMVPNGPRMVARIQESAQMNPTAVPEPLGWDRSRSHFFFDFWRVSGRGTGAKGSGTAVGFMWADSWILATILDPFRPIW